MVKTKSTEKTASKGSNPALIGVASDEDILLVKTINDIKTESQNYRDTFAGEWTKIEEQINLKHPAAWDKKEDWQTKIFIPDQNKLSEAADAQIKDLLFANRRFFAIVGIDNDEDKKKAGYLSEIYDVFFEQGKFFLHNAYVVKESVNIGTSMLKMLPDPEDKGFVYSWRSIRNCLLDPRAVVDYDDSKYTIEVYNEDLSTIMQDDLYDKDAVDQLLVDLSGQSAGAKPDQISAIPNAEGSEELKVSRQYQEVELTEFWGVLPTKKTKEINGQEVEYILNEWRTITLANSNLILRNDKNDVEVSPYSRARLKRKLNHVYANGFCWNTTGLQDLSNSLVNLGFDTAKLKSLPVTVVDESKIKDLSSIEMRPLAKWYMQENGMDGVDIKLLGEDNMSNIIRDLAYIDQVIQDASSISRELQGVSFVKGRDETLGQTEIKLAAAERGVLKYAREFTEDYIVPMLKKQFKIMTHKSMVKQYQKLVDRILGMKEVENPANIVAQQNAQLLGMPFSPLPPTFESKLNLAEIGEMNVDFKAIGIVNFEQKTKVPALMKGILDFAAADPEIALLIEKDKVLERWMKSGDVTDYEDLMKSPESLGQISGILQGLINPQGSGGVLPMQAQGVPNAM